MEQLNHVIQPFQRYHEALLHI
uniref:Uncharacterized protein n=1 Tax=Anguilla anguilla TaxID=7936 RepID=A0A0E9TMA4_ANGAN